ncbi:MAG: nucleotide exchange factor GrpE [Candidatus Zambryskibacteria bacterium]|nr:nucleotide exchange factor GrpE [Candidatus Zambryskibacteria bacterium]
MKDTENDNEIVEEELDDSVVAEEHAGDAIAKLKGKLKEAEGKAKEYLDGWQRSQADFTNIRKRDEEAKVEFLKFANADLVSQLLPVLDSLELSLPHGNKELEVIYKQLLSVLKSNGFEESNPVGERFDPRLHESIGTIPTDKSEDDHKILEVVQKGYILQGKIIRPAKVRIGEFKE